MSSVASFLVALLLALPIAATPVEVRASHITLPLAKRINTSGGTIQLLKHDQARATALKARRTISQSNNDDNPSDNADVINHAVAYVAAVNVGTPSTSYDLIVDTGSSNTWVGAGRSYQPTNTSEITGQGVAVVYGSGAFDGLEYTDTVSLSADLIITDQSIGGAFASDGFDGFDGILGIGPIDLTRGTLIPDREATIPTVTDNLYTQGVIGSEVVGVYFEPTRSESTTNGELTFGRTDSSKYTGDLNFVPLTTTSPAKDYWGINQSISYDGKTILAETAGIVDTGTTLILVASDAFEAYREATGATEDQTTGLLKISADQYTKLQILKFTIGSDTYELTPDAQTWPRALNTLIGGDPGSIYLIVGDIGTPSGQGLDFIDGMTFLERFYSVFDTTNGQIGFAQTDYTYRIFNQSK